jgi:hypothetical protein
MWLRQVCPMMALRADRAAGWPRFGDFDEVRAVRVPWNGCLVGWPGQYAWITVIHRTLL